MKQPTETKACGLFLWAKHLRLLLPRCEGDLPVVDVDRADVAVFGVEDVEKVSGRAGLDDDTRD